MKKSQSSDPLSRRRFLGRAACASVGLTSMVNTLAHLRLIQSAVAQSSSLSDYKAMVCIFLHGGNDSNNMLVPTNDTDLARINYAAARPIGHPLHLSSANTISLPNAITFPGSAATQFGLHSAMTHTANLFNTDQLSFVANVGTLVEPIATHDEYFTKPVPPNLFSHSDQQLHWQSSIPDRPFQSGWGGRIADLLHATENGANPVAMNISISGQNSFQVGREYFPYAIGTGGVTSLATTGGTATDKLVTPAAIDSIHAQVHQHLLEDGYRLIVKNARDREAQFGTALTASGSGTTVGDNIDAAFTAAYPGVAILPSIADQLKMVIRLIHGRSQLGNKRQIFFVQMTGFDTHQEQKDDHTALLGDLDKALFAFRTAVDAIATGGTASPFNWNDVTLFTHSDFTRTLQPNGSDDVDGTDHGWGGHQIVLGGSVRGRRIFGKFPNLLVGNTGIDVDSNRGRWIPTTAVDQYASVVAKWFGVPTGSPIREIFPNLERFQSPDAIPSNLDFLV